MQNVWKKIKFFQKAYTRSSVKKLRNKAKTQQIGERQEGFTAGFERFSGIRKKSWKFLYEIKSTKYRIQLLGNPTPFSENSQEN